MDTRSATQQVRLHEWSGIIHARRESGLTVKEFCSQNGITETQYFYWLRKVRASVIETSGMKFVELPAPVEEKSVFEGTTGVIIELNGARIQVDSSRCRDTLSMVLEVLGNAQ